MGMRYQIGEFAQLAGVSAKTLRFYDEFGVLRPASVDGRTGYRHYFAEQLEDLASILALKNMGVSLAKIRELMAKRGSAINRKTVLTELKQTIEQSIESATNSLNWVNAELNELDCGSSPIPVVVKRRPAIAIASLRVGINNYTEVAEFERELCNALPPECVGPLSGVLWHRCADSGSLEAEPFVSLKRHVPARNSYQLKQLPEATLACAYSGLDDESAERAYVAIRRWMNIRGYRVAGPKRELNLDQVLEIQFPLMEH